MFSSAFAFVLVLAFAFSFALSFSFVLAHVESIAAANEERVRWACHRIARVEI